MSSQSPQSPSKPETVPTSVTSTPPAVQPLSVPATAETGPVITHKEPEVAPRRRLLPVVLAAVAVAAIVAVGLWYFLAPRVEVAMPLRGPAVEAVYATGTVEATATIPIAARVTGHLQEILVDEGAEVKAGQLLARLDDRDAQEALRQLAAQEDYAKREFDRVAKLFDSGSVARSSYDRAYSDWQAAQAARARAAAEADFLKLTAPADGRIVKREGEIGQLVPAGQAVLWLIRNEPLRITTSVDEEDISSVKIGQPVLIRADAFPNRTFEGSVQSITPMGDSVARSYRVRVELSGETPLLIGMTAETNIVIRKDDNALLVPATAVDKDHIWRVVDGRLVQQKVKIGVHGTDKVEILEGLSDGDQFVVASDPSFKAGSRVRTKTAPGA